MRARGEGRANRWWREFTKFAPAHAHAPDSPAGQVASGGMAFVDQNN